MTIANGSLADADDVTSITKIQEIYTGSGFDSGAAHELTVIPASELVVANYVKITVTYQAISTIDPSTIQSITLLPQIKEVGGSYGNITSAQTIVRRDTGAGLNLNRYHAASITFTGTITAGMRTNGLQIKLTTVQGGAASFSNTQTIVELTL